MITPIRFTHANKNRALRYTVAYSFEKGSDGVLNVTYGVAQCRKNDTFSRAEGRRVAEARLLKASNTGKVDLMYGKVSIKDEPGLSVGRTVADLYESDRKAVLAAQNAIDSANADLATLLGLRLVHR